MKRTSLAGLSVAALLAASLVAVTPASYADVAVEKRRCGGTTKSRATATPTPEDIEPDDAEPTPTPDSDDDKPSDAGQTPAQTLGYANPAFEDDFSQTTAEFLQSPKWMQYTGGSKHTTKQYSAQAGGARDSKKAVKLNNGVMTITGDTNGVTAGMSTEKSHRQKYGLWEIRAKLPPGSAAYNAVFIVQTGQSDLDFVETYGDASRRQIVAHLKDGPPAEGMKKLTDNDWHTWAVEWTPSGVAVYMDGESEPWAKTGPVAGDGGVLTIQQDWFPEEGAMSESKILVDSVKIYPAKGSTGATQMDDPSDAVGSNSSNDEPVPTATDTPRRRNGGTARTGKRCTLPRPWYTKIDTSKPTVQPTPTVTTQETPKPAGK